MLEQLDSYDHPLLHSHHLVKADNEACHFMLDNTEQALKLRDLLNEYGLKAITREEILILDTRNSIPDFSVLNTRRAYFFDELIFGR